MRISQKIMLLVTGLTLGFIAIGIAYFIQINTEAKLKEHEGHIGVVELNLNVVCFGLPLRLFLPVVGVPSSCLRCLF